MSNERLTRRQFLEMSTLAAVGLALSGCVRRWPEEERPVSSPRPSSTPDWKATQRIEDAKGTAAAIEKDAEGKATRVVRQAEIEATEQKLSARETALSQREAALKSTAQSLQAEQPVETSTPTPIQQSTEEVDVCVVEDNSGFIGENHRAEIEGMLEETLKGFKIKGRVSGFTDYGKEFQSAECDFIVADYTVPGINGPEGIALYKGAQNERPFVVANSMSGSPNWSPEDVERGLVDEIVRKPNRSAIRTIFETWLRKIIDP